MRLRILGCGTSSGVPRIGNEWGTCDPGNPKNRRLRVSILVENDGDIILVDTSPDLREQLLKAEVRDLSAVIWTHDHADHCHGIDDLRQVFHIKGQTIPGYARQETLETLKSRFGYVFEGKGGYPAVAEARLLPDQFDVNSIRVRVIDQPHGRITSAGLRFDAGGASIGYATDFNVMTDEMRALFAGIDVWVVDALRHHPHPTHPHVAEVLQWVEELRPKRTLLTHMDNSMDYDSLSRELPAGIEPGFDGLEITL